MNASKEPSIKVIKASELTKRATLKTHLVFLFVCLNLGWLTAIVLLSLKGIEYYGIPKLISPLRELVGWDTRLPSLWIVFIVALASYFTLRKFVFLGPMPYIEPCSDEFMETVRGATRCTIKRLPEFATSILERQKYRITAATRVIDVLPESKHQKVRLGKQLNLETASGLFLHSGKLIVVGESTLINDQWVSRRSGANVEHTIAHEIGHAVDWHLGRFSSNNREFREAYRKDMLKLKGSEWTRFEYFVQGGSDCGKGETFAELFCKHVTTHDRFEVALKFPTAAEVVNRKLTSEEQKFQKRKKKVQT